MLKEHEFLDLEINFQCESCKSLTIINLSHICGIVLCRCGHPLCSKNESYLKVVGLITPRKNFREV